MATAPTLDATGAATGTQQLPALFDVELNPALLHLAVRAEQAARRQGTHSTKNRSKVRGGGKKPYRQKGTGRARQGSIRAPQFTGGGVVWGPRPHGYEVKINRRERHAALNGALSAHAQRGTLAIAAAGFGLDAAPKTQVAHRFLATWLGGTPKLEDAPKVLVVLGRDESLVARSLRNIPKVTVLRGAGALSVEAVVGHRHLLFSAEGLATLPTPRPRRAVEEVAS